jgi:hypothetical protein
VPNLNQAWDLTFQEHLTTQLDQSINRMEDKLNELSLPAEECALILEVDQIKFETFKPILETKQLCVNNMERQVMFQCISQLDYAFAIRLEDLLKQNKDEIKAELK